MVRFALLVVAAVSLLSCHGISLVILITKRLTELRQTEYACV